MDIKCINVGYLRTNCYILIKNNECLVIDPGDEEKKIIDTIGNNKVLGILVTHHHEDHVGVLKEIKNKYGCPVIEYPVNEGNTIIGNFSFDIIYFPGHKDDLIAFYFKEYKAMFVGDFIFRDSIGRMDLPGGDYNSMFNSINKLLKYKEDIKIYPGHGEFTDLDYESKNLIRYFN